MNTSSGEIAYIQWLRERIGHDPRVLIGPGDDAAALRPTPDRPVLLTTDMLMEGTCFSLSASAPRLVGRKAMAVNLSDIAAMAGKPVAAVVSVALPRAGGRSLAEELFVGMRQLADEFETAIVGGDTNSWDGPLVLSIAVIGEAMARGPVKRSGAQPGDWLFVTGPLGGSIRGKHLSFQPRVREALALHEVVDLHAMIDISDGLAIDLWRICAESKCGAALQAEAIPISDDARTFEDGKSALDHALTDGEDFELAFAVAPADGLRLLEGQPIPGIYLTPIGVCVEAGLCLVENGVRRALEPGGYEHALD
jgi:thiamine-monophosphate kinase